MKKSLFTIQKMLWLVTLILVSMSLDAQANIDEILKGTTFARLPDSSANHYITQADGTIHLGNNLNDSKVVYRFYLPPVVGSSDLEYLRLDTYGTGEIDNIKAIVDGTEYLIASDVDCRWQYIFTSTEISNYVVPAGDAVGGRVLEIQVEVVNNMSECFLDEIVVSYNYPNETIVQKYMEAYSCYLAFDEASQFYDTLLQDIVLDGTQLDIALFSMKSLACAAMPSEVVGFLTDKAIDKNLGLTSSLYNAVDRSYFISEHLTYPNTTAQISNNCETAATKAKELALLWRNGFDGLLSGEADAIKSKIDEFDTSCNTAINSITSTVNNTLYPTYKQRWDPPGDGDGSPCSSSSGDGMAEILIKRFGLMLAYGPFDENNQPEADFNNESIAYEFLEIFDDQAVYLNNLFPPADPVPDRPTLLFPADDTFAKGSVTFYWNESATADNYHLQISLNFSFSDLIYEVFGPNLTSYKLYAVPDNGSTKLYWRVKAGNASGWSLYSDYWVFTSGCMNGDFDSDCDADFDDLAIFVSRWLDMGCTNFDLCQGTDLVRSSDVDFKDFAAFAKQWQKTTPNPFDKPYPPEPAGMVFVSINDSGDGMIDYQGNPIIHEGFRGQMSKYETTNAQYCQFLNSALVSGDIVIEGDSVKGADGSNAGVDFVGDLYYNLTGAGSSQDGATNGGAAKINHIDGAFTVDNGFENHPVTHVSWYGARAFCDYYGYRLPTRWEWQAVADYDGSYTYGCGTSINNSIANYRDSTHPDGTTIVGSFGNPLGYGYGMCDMAGSVWEWTDTLHITGNHYINPGGSWASADSKCGIFYYYALYPNTTEYRGGFRVCRGNERLVPDVVNITQSSAETTITDVYFIVGTITHEYSDTIALDNVMSQNPPAGELLPPGQKIDFVVSLGPGFAIPYVVDITQSAAETVITNAGLTVGTITYEYSDTIALDNVISQNPAAGELLAPGGAVDLVIAIEPSVIAWVPINDPGFNGEMSKYETTNSQFCQYLNSALGSGDIYVSGNTVYGSNGSNNGTDYVGLLYYNLAGSGYTYNGATNGGAARINYSGNSFTVDSGFESHPVTYVSWYGATAFANYYGWRLPSEWEWQAVADYDGSYIYGCGTNINNSVANYVNSTHPDGTTVVGSFGSYGYGIRDMAGNLMEWTSATNGSNRIVRGGSWSDNGSDCTVSYRRANYPNDTYDGIGFRVCR